MRPARPAVERGKLGRAVPKEVAGAIIPLNRNDIAAGANGATQNSSKSSHVPLRQRDIFQKLSPEERVQVLSKCVERHFKSGTLLYAQGTRHIDSYIVKTGLIRTYYSSPMGREIALAYWSNGDLLGGPHFFDEERLHLWSAQAVEDCAVLAIKGHDLKFLAAHIPSLAEQVFDALCFKMHWFSLLVQTLGTESVINRVANLLLNMSELYGIGCDEGIEIKSFSQEDLAHMVGATRQAVSAALGHLQKGGLLRVRKRRLMVLNVDVLRTLSE